MRLFSVVFLLVAALVPIAASPARAATAVTTAITMFSEPDDWIGEGRPRYFYPGNATFELYGTAGEVTISAYGGSVYEDDWFDFEFAAPPGKKLQSGLYTKAEEPAWRDPGHPGIAVSGSGRGCTTVGRFDVKDIGFNSNGKVNRLWLTYEQRCTGSHARLFGEVRYRVPNAPSDVLVLPKMIWWPDTEVGEPGLAVPVTVVSTGTSTVNIASVTVSGRHSADFAKPSDRCAGTSLAPRRACQIFVRFLSPGPGPRIASLVIKDTAGRSFRVVLDAFAWKLRSRLSMQSDPGDFIGQGKTWNYSSSNGDDIEATGDRWEVRAHVTGASGSWEDLWDADFVAPRGDVLVPGNTYFDARAPDFGPGGMLEVSGSGRICESTGQYTVRSLGTWPDGFLRSATIDFQQRCNSTSYAALRGTLEYRVPYGDNTPPGSVSGVKVSRNGSKAVVSWTNPNSADYAFTVVRYLYGKKAPGSPNGSFFGYADTGTKATLSGLAARPIAVSIYAVDSSGNVGARSTVVSNPSSLRTSVTMFSPGKKRFFYPGNATIRFRGDANDLYLEVISGDLGLYADHHTLWFAAPAGETWHRGLYTEAQPIPFQEPGHPGIDVGDDCVGQFDIRDIRLNSEGKVTLLWLTFGCGYGRHSILGEVQYRVPDGLPDLQMFANAIWWPEIESGDKHMTVPVTLVATGSNIVTIRSATVTGRHAADFFVRSDECTGVTLAPGQKCHVFLRFLPKGPGPRVATLVVQDGSGRVRTTALDGFVRKTRTTFTAHSERGDYVGQGRDWAYSTTAGDSIFILKRSDPVHVAAVISGAYGDTWSADFEAPSGERLTPGTTYSATRWGWHYPGAGMDISAESRGCNTLSGTFTPRSISFNDDGSLRTTSIDFEQHCEGGDPALSGKLEFRVPFGDWSPPSPATNVRVMRSGSGADVTWTNPASADYAFTMVRYVYGRTAPGSPNSGFLGYADSGSRVTITGLRATEPLAVSVYAIDSAGNASVRTAFVAEPTS